MNTKERISQYLNFKGISLTKAEVMLNWGKGSLTKSSSMSTDKLEELLLLFNDLSAEWLLRGEGDMLKSCEPQPKDVSTKICGEFEIDNEGYLKLKMK